VAILVRSCRTFAGDISKEAAKKFDVLGDGTAKVRIEAKLGG